MSLAESLRDRAAELFNRVRQHSVGKNAGEVIRTHGIEVIQDLMKGAEEQSIKGDDKKAAVLELLGEFYDRVIEPIDLPGPDAVIDPLLKRGLLTGADYVIDGLAAIMFPKSPAA